MFYFLRFLQIFLVFSLIEAYSISSVELRDLG